MVEIRCSLQSAREQWEQTALAVERRQVVEASHMSLANEYLGNRAASGAVDHFVEPRRLEIDTDLLDLGHAARFQQRLGALAIRTEPRAVHQYACTHADFPTRSPQFLIGSPASRHAASPPPST